MLLCIETHFWRKFSEYTQFLFKNFPRHLGKFFSRNCVYSENFHQKCVSMHSNMSTRPYYSVTMILRNRRAGVSCKTGELGGSWKRGELRGSCETGKLGGSCVIIFYNTVREYFHSPSSSSRRTGHKEEPELYAQELPEKQWLIIPLFL